MKGSRLLAFAALAAFVGGMLPNAAHAMKLEGVKGFTPYAEVRANIAWKQTKAGKDATTGKEADSVTTYDNGNVMLPSSYVGMKFEGDKVKANARIWMGTGAKNNGDYSAGLNQLWIEYNTGTMKFFVGKDDAPYVMWSNQAFDEWNGLWGLGVCSSGREEQVKFTFQDMFYIDFMQPDKTGVVESKYEETLFPKTAVGFKMSQDMFSVNLGVCANYSKFVAKDDVLMTAKDEDGKQEDIKAIWDGKSLYSGFAYLNGSVKASALTILYSFDYGMNAGNAGQESWYGDKTVGFKDKDFSKTTSYEGFIEAMYNFGPFSLGAGVGHVTVKKNENRTGTGKGDAKDNQTWSYYVTGAIPVNEVINVYPEVSFIDNKKTSAGVQGEQTVWAGALVTLSI